MRHLVTGGAGFVGSHLVAALLARGDEVEVLDDLSGFGHADRVAAGRPTAGSRVHPLCAWTHGSVLDPRAVERVVARVDRVWHLAAVVGVPRVLADPRRAVRVNLEGTEVVLDAALLDEVTALVEWPAPLAGRFEERFLELPPEVVIATVQDHQRYFPVRDAAGRLTPQFVTVANIDSSDPDQVRAGNERVVRPRLAARAAA